MTTKRNCAHVDSSNNPCWKIPTALGYCDQHVHLEPTEAGVLTMLDDRIRSTSNKLRALGDDILLKTVVAKGKVEESTLRDYRAIWFQHNYLVVLRKNRRPGESLPAEALLDF